MALTTAERSANYRAKDVEGYRTIKRALAKTEHHKKTRREYARKWRAKNRIEYNAKMNELHKKKYRERSREDRHTQHIKYTYGLTKEQYNNMLESQNNKCLICESATPRGNKAWHVDHDHVTGKIRGLLCNYCNPRLGWYETYLTKIQEYLNKQTSRGGKENE